MKRERERVKTQSYVPVRHRRFLLAWRALWKAYRSRHTERAGRQAGHGALILYVCTLDESQHDGRNTGSDACRDRQTDRQTRWVKEWHSWATPLCCPVSALPTCQKSSWLLDYSSRWDYVQQRLYRWLCNAAVWRLSVCLSVCHIGLHTQIDSPWAASVFIHSWLFAQTQCKM